jgi:hypothetical protein
MLIRLDNTEFHAPSLICLTPLDGKGSVIVPPGGSCAISVEQAKALEPEIRATNTLRTHASKESSRGTPLKFRSVTIQLVDDDGSLAPVDADTLFTFIASGDVK